MVDDESVDCQRRLMEANDANASVLGSSFGWQETLVSVRCDVDVKNEDKDM